MKKCMCLLLLCLLLTGCGADTVWETLTDVLADSTRPAPCVIRLELPEEAVQTVMASDAGALYLCDGYTVTAQTYPSGDLDATLRYVTGFSRENLTLLETEKGRRYDCVWTAAGESGTQVGRTMVLCDGGYHYAISMEAPEELAGELTQVWEELLTSVSLG